MQWSISLRCVTAAVALTVIATAQVPAQQARPTVDQFLSTASPLELVSARKADRIAWTVYEKGLRNVYTAAAPSFTPLRITRFLQDDGEDVSDVSLSDDGRVVVFVRGMRPTAMAGWPIRHTTRMDPSARSGRRV